MKFYCGPLFLVEYNYKNIKFYTYNVSDGENEELTILWNYNIEEEKVNVECVFSGMMCIYKYDMIELKKEVQYIGKSFWEYTFGGVNKHGETIWVYEGKGAVGPLLIDKKGNVYFSVDGESIVCLDKAGKELWNWKESVEKSENILGQMLILKYCYINNRIYVIRNGYVIILSLEGYKECEYAITDYEVSMHFEILGDRIYARNPSRKEIICYDLCGKILWKYVEEANVRITDVYPLKSGKLFWGGRSLGSKDKTYGMINQMGELLWKINTKDVTQIDIQKDKIVLINKENITFYDESGMLELQEKTKGHIIGGYIIRDKLIMLVNRKGSVSVVSRDLRQGGKESVVELLFEGKNHIKNLKKSNGFWEKQLTNYILMNYNIWDKYVSHKKIKSYVLSYEPFNEIMLSAIGEDDSKIDVHIKEISYEKILLSDREIYKEASYLSEIWEECSNVFEEEEINRILMLVHDMLEEELGEIEVMLN